MLTKVQWADAFRRGLFADGKYRSGLLEDHDKRLNFSSKFGSSCTLLCSKGQWMLLWRQQFLFFIMWKNTNLFYLLWIVVYIKTWNYVLLGSWEKIYLHFCKKKIPILFILLYIDLSPRSRYVHQDSVKLLYPAGLAWATALPCCGARRFVF